MKIISGRKELIAALLFCITSGLFAQTFTEQAQNMKDNVPDKTIFQFIEQLKLDSVDNFQISGKQKEGG